MGWWIIIASTCLAKLLPVCPLPFCFMLRKRGSKTKQQNTLKTQHGKGRTHAIIGIFCFGKMGSSLPLKGWSHTNRMIVGKGGQNTHGERTVEWKPSSPCFLFSVSVCPNSLSSPCFVLCLLYYVTNTKYSKKAKTLNLGGKVLSLSPHCNIC
jgi:hypothetical protein